MGYLPDPKTTTILVTASAIPLNGQRRKIIVETRPEFAVIYLHGSKERYPLAWESIFEAAVSHDRRNRDLEETEKRLAPITETLIESKSEIAETGLPTKKKPSPVRIRKVKIA